MQLLITVEDESQYEIVFCADTDDNCALYHMLVR